MSDITVSVPDTREFIDAASPFLARVKEFTIASTEDEAALKESFKESGARQKKIKEFFKPIKQAADKAHEAVCAKEKESLAPWLAFDALAAPKLKAWADEQRRIAEEATRAANEAARKAEEDRLLADAQHAESAGDVEGSEAILNEPVHAPVVHVAPAIAKVQGVGTQVRYKANVKDKLALVKFIAANPQYLNAVEPNMTVLNNLARSMREMFKLPGVEALPEESFTRRTG